MAKSLSGISKPQSRFSSSLNLNHLSLNNTSTIRLRMKTSSKPKEPAWCGTQIWPPNSSLPTMTIKIRVSMFGTWERPTTQLLHSKTSITVESRASHGASPTRTSLFQLDAISARLWLTLRQEKWFWSSQAPRPPMTQPFGHSIWTAKSRPSTKTVILTSFRSNQLALSLLERIMWKIKVNRHLPCQFIANKLIQDTHLNGFCLNVVLASVLAVN